MDLMELTRCRDADGVDEVTGPLDKAKIPYRVGSTAVSFDISKIGTGDDPEVIISVRKADYPAAREILETEYSKVHLPDDHYLLSSTDEELAEILANDSEWGAFDVAHARRLAEDRGLDSVSVEEIKVQTVRRLSEGKSASTGLLVCGWGFAIFGSFFFFLGSLVGFGIAWSLCYMKEKTIEEEYFTYDADSRKLGFPMLVVASVMLAISTCVFLYFTLKLLT